VKVKVLLEVNRHLSGPPQTGYSCDTYPKSINLISLHSLILLMFFMRKLSKRKQIQRLRQAAEEIALQSIEL